MSTDVSPSLYTSVGTPKGAQFLSSTMVFVAIPQPALHWARTVVVQSLEVFTDGTAPVAVRTSDPAVRTDAGSDRAESRRRETIQSDLAGRARVIDGDTIEVGSARVRLFGVDAPESAQSCVAASRPWPCGRQATLALAGRIDNRSVACEERDRDRYGRIVAVCRQGGQDVNAWLARGRLGVGLPSILADVHRRGGGGESGAACGEESSFLHGTGTGAIA